MSIKSGPTSGIKVFLQTCSIERGGKPSRPVLKHPKWQALGGEFQEIDLTKIDGKNFASKFEVVLAMLTQTSINFDAEHHSSIPRTYHQISSAIIHPHH